MPIPLRLEHVIERLGHDGPAWRLRRLTGRHWSGPAAREAWPRILEHKWLLSERLGRDVGLRVAAVDSLENVR